MWRHGYASSSGNGGQSANAMGRSYASFRQYRSLRAIDITDLGPHVLRRWLSFHTGTSLTATGPSRMGVGFKVNLVGVGRGESIGQMNIISL